jgi:hypothetical protein
LKHLKKKENSYEIREFLSYFNQSPNIGSKVYRTLIILEATEGMKEFNIPGLLKIHVPLIMD